MESPCGEVEDDSRRGGEVGTGTGTGSKQPVRVDMIQSSSRQRQAAEVSAQPERAAAQGGG